MHFEARKVMQHLPCGSGHTRPGDDQGLQPVPALQKGPGRSSCHQDLIVRRVRYLISITNLNPFLQMLFQNGFDLVLRFIHDMNMNRTHHFSSDV
jgi:hypothetical protein